MPNNIPNSDNESREKRLKNISIFYFIPFAIIVIALICILLFTGIKTFDTKEWSIGLFVLIFLCLTLAILSIIIVVLGLREVSRTLHFNMKGDINDEIEKLKDKTKDLDVKKLNTDIGGLKTKTKDLDVEQLKKDIGGLKTKTEDLDVEQLKKDIDGLKTKTKDLDVEQLKKDIDGLNEKTKDLDVEQLKKDIDGLNEKTKDLDVEQLKNDISDLKI